MSNLVLHCGGAEVSREELSHVAIPPATRSYTPIRHDYFVNILEQEIEEAGFVIVNQAHALAKDGAHYFGLLEIGNTGSPGNEYSTVLGARNSNSKEFIAEIALGGFVFVCDNLSFMGTKKVGHRHTTHVMEALPLRIAAALKNEVAAMSAKQHERFQSYKRNEIKMDPIKVVLEMMEREIVPAQRIPTVLKEWDKPRHREHDRYGDSGWKMFNAATEALKGTKNIVHLMDRTARLHTLIDEAILDEAA